MRAALFVVPFVVLGCRTQCMADDDATPEQLAKEKRAAGRAQIVCKELQRPTIRLEGERLRLSASREVDVAARADVPPDAPRFDPLFLRLDRYKRHYKQVWPADPFEPFAYVELDPALDGARAKTLVSTIAAAGYTSMRLIAGDASVDIAWSVCGAAVQKEPPATARDLVAVFADACKR